MDKDDIVDALKGIGFVVALIVGMFALIMLPIFFMEAYSCNKYEEVTERETEFAGLSCYVRDATGRMVPQDEYNARAITNERN